MSNKRANKKKSTKQGKSENQYSVTGNKLSNLTDNMPTMNEGMKAVKGLPLATIGTVAAFAVTGYTLWRNREKIMGFFGDVDLQGKFGSFGDAISEKASAVTGMISGKKAGKQGSSEVTDYN